jgi:hypothetical protein
MACSWPCAISMSIGLSVLNASLLIRRFRVEWFRPTTSAWRWAKCPPLQCCLCHLRPESSQEHLPTNIAGVLRLRALNPSVWDRSAKRFAQDDGFFRRLECSWFDWQQTREDRKRISQPFRAGLTFGGRPSGPCTYGDLCPVSSLLTCRRHVGCSG